MKIGFFSPHLCIQGTTVAIFDYAKYNQSILGNESFIIYERDHAFNNGDVIHKFKQEFGDNSIVAIEDISKLDWALKSWCCDAVYIIKPGKSNDGRMATACKTLIHVIGMENDPHGDVYAYGSNWLAKACSSNTLPAVPYMVDLPNYDKDLRSGLEIPQDAIVFGRHGGYDTWNLRWVEQSIKHLVETREDVYFLFQNTPEFYKHPHIIHFPAAANMYQKTAFINTCDAMLHARHEGESFGLACGEFSIRNKPVITWGESRERNHIATLGDKGIYYDTAHTLTQTLENFQPEPDKDWNCYKEYTPEKIMTIFDNVFLKG